MVCLAFVSHHALKSLAKPVPHGIGISFYFNNVTKFELIPPDDSMEQWLRDHLCDLWCLTQLSPTNKRLT